MNTHRKLAGALRTTVRHARPAGREGVWVTLNDYSTFPQRPYEVQVIRTYAFEVNIAYQPTDNKNFLMFNRERSFERNCKTAPISRQSRFLTCDKSLICNGWDVKQKLVFHIIDSKSPNVTERRYIRCVFNVISRSLWTLCNNLLANYPHVIQLRQLAIIGIAAVAADDNRCLLSEKLSSVTATPPSPQPPQPHRPRPASLTAKYHPFL